MEKTKKEKHLFILIYNNAASQTFQGEYESVPEAKAFAEDNEFEECSVYEVVKKWFVTAPSSEYDVTETPL